jgi:acylphosphatase
LISADEWAICLTPAREAVRRRRRVMQRTTLLVLACVALLAAACSPAKKPNPPLPATVADMVPADSPLPPPAPAVDAPRRVHVIVSGKVQKVGYRDFVVKQAKEFGITGWVKNLPDGTVEMTAEGPRGGIDALLAEMATGPKKAVVTDVKVADEKYVGEFKTFTRE